MNANITSQIKSSTGSINVIYRDSIADIGVRFSSSSSTGSISYTSDPTMEELGSVYQSLNYGLASQKYTITLITSTGSVTVDGESSHP